MPAGPKLEDAVTGRVGDLLPSLIGYSLQGSHDARSLPSQTQKREDDFGIVSQYPIAERYADGHLSVVLDVTAKRNGNAVGQQWSSSGERVDIDLPAFILQFQAINRNNVRHWDEQMVFVVNVEIVKGANIAVAVPSFVRFYSIHKQIKQCRTANYFSSLLKRRFVVLPVVTDEKLSLGGVESLRAQSADDFTVCDIESAAQIMNCVSGNQCEVAPNGSVPRAVVEEMLPRLRVNLDGSGVGIWRSADALLKIRDVLFGPFDL